MTAETSSHDEGQEISSDTSSREAASNDFAHLPRADLITPWSSNMMGQCQDTGSCHWHASPPSLAAFLHWMAQLGPDVLSRLMSCAELVDTTQSQGPSVTLETERQPVRVRAPPRYNRICLGHLFLILLLHGVDEISLWQVHEIVRDRSSMCPRW